MTTHIYRLGQNLILVSLRQAGSIILRIINNAKTLQLGLNWCGYWLYKIKIRILAIVHTRKFANLCLKTKLHSIAHADMNMKSHTDSSWKIGNNTSPDTSGEDPLTSVNWLSLVGWCFREAPERPTRNSKQTWPCMHKGIIYEHVSLKSITLLST